MVLATSAIASEKNKPLPFNLPKVTEIEIKTSSTRLDMGEKTNPNVPDEDCAGFVVTKDMVRKFFRYAHPVSNEVYTHQLEWSACYAEGTVVFANKDVGNWTISRFGRGSLLVKKGNNQAKEKTLLLYCRKCENEKW